MSIVGATAVGGKLAVDEHANGKRKAERAISLCRTSSVPTASGGIARGRLDQERDELSDGQKRKLVAVHDTRKGFKRLRATVRLARAGLATRSTGARTRRSETPPAPLGSARRIRPDRDARRARKGIQEIDLPSRCNEPSCARNSTTRARRRLNLSTPTTPWSKPWWTTSSPAHAHRCLDLRRLRLRGTEARAAAHLRPRWRRDATRARAARR